MERLAEVHNLGYEWVQCSTEGAYPKTVLDAHILYGEYGSLGFAVIDPTRRGEPACSPRADTLACSDVTVIPNDSAIPGVDRACL